MQRQECMTVKNVQSNDNMLERNSFPAAAAYGRRDTARAQKADARYEQRNLRLCTVVAPVVAMPLDLGVVLVAFPTAGFFAVHAKPPAAPDQRLYWLWKVLH